MTRSPRPKGAGQWAAAVLGVLLIVAVALLLVALIVWLLTSILSMLTGGAA